MAKKKATADELNEKINLQAKAPEWKAASVYGDVAILAKKTGCSRVIVSKLLNKGEGSLKNLRIVNAYYEQRAAAI